MITTMLLSALLGLAAVTGETGGHEAAAWIELLPGKDLSSWRMPHGDWLLAAEVGMDPKDPKRLIWKPGAAAAVNGSKGRTVHLVTAREFGDIEAHIEFMVPKGSNSGVYFMGRYEVQVYDSYGVVKPPYPGHECGGIYPRWIDGKGIDGHSPRENASLPPGQWQTFDVVFRAPRFGASGRKTRDAAFVKVVHNGKVIHGNVDLTGPTRAALYQDEKPTGPLMVQGDHGPVAYRNVRVRLVPPEGSSASK